MLWLARTPPAQRRRLTADLAVEYAETAAMYVADWLRRLSKLPLSMLLLDERWAGTGDLPLADVTAYTPVTNVADHYRWTLARRTHVGETASGLCSPRVP